MRFKPLYLVDPMIAICVFITSYVMLLCCLLQVNGALPEKIVVFRDGVGDGDMRMISDFEIPQFFEGFSMFGKIQSSYYLE